MVANRNDGAAALGQAGKSFVDTFFSSIPIVKSQVITIDEAAHEAFGMAKVFSHEVEIIAGLEDKAIGAGIGKVRGEFYEVAVGAEKHFFAGVMKRFPELGIAWYDDFSVEIWMHERAAGPDEIVVLNDDFSRGLRPSFHVEKSALKEGVQDLLQANGLRGGQEQHLPAKGGDGAGDNSFIVSTGRKLVGKVPMGLLDDIFVCFDLFVKIGQGVFGVGVKRPDLFGRLEGAFDGGSKITAVGGIEGMSHIGDATGFGPVHNAVIYEKEKIVHESIVSVAH